MAAIINSLVATSKDSKIGFETWLADILQKLAKIGMAKIDTLLPHRWETKQN